MPAPVAPNKHSASLKRVVAATLLGATLVVGLTALYSWQDYRETVERGEERARLLAAVLEGYATRTLHETESAMTTKFLLADVIMKRRGKSARSCAPKVASSGMRWWSA